MKQEIEPGISVGIISICKCKCSLRHGIIVITGHNKSSVETQAYATHPHPSIQSTTSDQHIPIHPSRAPDQINTSPSIHPEHHIRSTHPHPSIQSTRSDQHIPIHPSRAPHQIWLSEVIYFPHAAWLSCLHLV